MKHLSFFDDNYGFIVHSLDGTFYSKFRAYVEKHGGKWTEQRDLNGQLQSVYLQFPPGTGCIEISPSENHERRQITFPDGAILFWSIQRITRFNSISVPYIYL